MKKIKLFLFLLMGYHGANAQDISYGALLGFNMYDIEIDGPLIAENGYSSVNFGGFIDYKLNDSFGLRGNLLYSNVKEDNYASIISGQGYVPFFAEAEIKSLQIHTLLKYDVNRVYNKGFYVLGGFRTNAILSVAIDGEKNDNFYKKVNLGGMLGFGVHFAKYFGVEIIPEINLTNTLDSEDNKSRNFGIYTNLIVNLDSFIKK